MSSTFRAVFSSALLTAGTEGLIPFCFSPLSHTHTHTYIRNTYTSNRFAFYFIRDIHYTHVQYQHTSLDAPERISAMPPQAFGDDMDVPFISWVPRRVQLGTDAIAPPGALMLTPRAPSVLGPLDDQVYWLGGSFSLREYSATIMSGVTYAPTPKGRHEQQLKQHVTEVNELQIHDV